MSQNKELPVRAVLDLKYDQLPEPPGFPPPNPRREVSQSWDFMCRLKRAVNANDGMLIDQLKNELKATSNSETKAYLEKVWLNQWRNQ